MTKKLTYKEFVEKSKKVHGDKYYYDNFKYVNVHTKGYITCPVHGDFLQTPGKHIYAKRGCPLCNGGIKKDLQQVIKESKQIHNIEYDFSNATYINSKTELCIICHKKDKYGNEHGEFWQTPSNHNNKSHPQGCPKCNQSQMENTVMLWLKRYNIAFEEQKTFDWLKYKNPLRLDFYLSDYNIAIECQGEQHYRPMQFSNGKENFAKTLVRDKQKRILCDDNGIVIHYIKYDDNIEESLNKILESIK